YSSDYIVQNLPSSSDPVQNMIVQSVWLDWQIEGGQIPDNGVVGGSYEFNAGAGVCSAAWFPGSAPAPPTWLPEAIQQSPIAKTVLWDGTGDPSAVWRDPTSADFA